MFTLETSSQAFQTISVLILKTFWSLLSCAQTCIMIRSVFLEENSAYITQPGEWSVPMVIYHTMFIPAFCFSGDIQIFLFSFKHFFTPRFLFRSQKDAEFFRPPETERERQLWRYRVSTGDNSHTRLNCK